MVWTVLGPLGGFCLASSLGFSKGLSGSYVPGLLIFAGLCFLAILELAMRRACGAPPGSPLPVREFRFKNYLGNFELPTSIGQL
jgi:nitrate/nitrite transporter NarK